MYMSIKCLLLLYCVWLYSALKRCPFSTLCTVSSCTMELGCILVITLRTSSSEHLSPCLTFFSRNSLIVKDLPRCSSSWNLHGDVVQQRYRLWDGSTLMRLARGTRSMTSVFVSVVVVKKNDRKLIFSSMKEFSSSLTCLKQWWLSSLIILITWNSARCRPCL